MTDPARTAAWGDPAVTLVCGAAKADPQAEQIELAPPQTRPVAFAVDDVGAATTLTAVGRRVPVAVTVPDAYDATLLVPLIPLLPG